MPHAPPQRLLANQLVAAPVSLRRHRTDRGSTAAGLLPLLALVLAMPAAARQNHAPSTRDVDLATNEDAAVEGAVVGTDVDGDALTFKLAHAPVHGQATIDRATGRLTYTPAKDYCGEDAFGVEVTDGRLATKSEVRVHVAPVNDAPVAGPVSLTTSEDTAAHGVSKASDVDGDVLAYRVSAPPSHGTASVDARSGALTYQPAADFNGADAFAIEVSDGTLSATFDVSVVVVAVNDAPAAAAASFSLDEDTPLEGMLAARDPDGDTVTFRLTRRPKHGELQLDAHTGAFTFRPARDTNGPDAFTFEASDGRLKSEATVSLDVRAVNDAPVASPLSLATREDTAVRAAVVASDVDGDVLTYRISRPASHGTASVDAGTGALTYQPSRDFNGADAFAVEVSDGRLSASSEVSVTIAAVNDAPVAQGATFRLEEDTPLTGKVVATDVDGDVLTFRLATKPAHGEATIDASTGALHYAPAKDFEGDDACSIEVSDGRLKTTATVRLQVAAVNDAPVAQPLSLATMEDAPARGTIIASDVDSALTFKVAVPASHGEARVDPNTGAVTYQPAPDFNGADAFSVEVSDGALSATTEVRVAVSAVNDPPVLAPTAFVIDEDSRLNETLTAHDVEGDALTYRIATRPSHGAAAIEPATGTLTYAPARDYFGDDALSVEVSDGQLTATAMVRLKVKAVNDAPVARPLALTTLEDTAARGTVVATDVDSVLEYRVSNAPLHGEARVDAAGAVTYQPAPDFNGADVFTVEVSDGELSAKSEVTVVVTPVNDAPVAPNTTFTTNEDTRLEATLPLSDVDGDALFSRVVSRPAHGVATVEPHSGKLSYVPAKDYNGDDSLTVEVSDGKLTATAAVTVHVTAVNDAPVASPLALTTREDQTTHGAIVAADVDRDTLSFRVVTPAVHGDASVDARTGAVTYIPAPDSNGTDGFVVEVSDGALTATSAVAVSVAAVDDPPVVHPATLETLEDTPADGKLPATEADGERLTFRILSAPRLGSAVLVDAATGAWRFTPGADLNGDDELAFDVSDGKTTVAGVLKLHVIAVNDAPTVASLALSTIEDRAVEGQLVGKDVDGDVLTYLISGPSKAGRAVLLDAAKGRVRFEPARDFNGETSFTVVATDGKLKSTPATVTVSVQPQNDAPVAADAALAVNEDEVLNGTMGATDVDGDPLAFRVVTAPLHGTVSLVDPTKGSFEYVPAPNYFGDDSFDFSATDPSMATSTARVRLVVNPVNDPPVAVPDSISAPYRGMITGRLKGYDRESGVVTFAIVDKPAHGVLRLLDPRTGEFTFSTDGDNSEELTARFVVSDGALTSPPAELSIQIHSM